MAGLLTQNQGQPVAPAPAAGAPMPGPQGVAPETGFTGEEEGGNVSPEEQAQYDEFVNNAYKLLYSEKTMPAVIDRIKSSPEPVEAVANIAASTVVRLEDSAVKAGKPISNDVLFQGGREIVEDLADMASEAGIHDFTDEEMEATWYQALDLYREMSKGKSGEMQQAAMQDVEALKQAEASGQLEQMLPGLSGRGKG